MCVIFTFTRRTAVAVIVLIFGMLGSTASVFAQVNPGDILVVDVQKTAGDGGILFSVNPASSSRKVISDLNNPVQDPPDLPEDAARSFILKDVAVSASGDIVILDSRSNEAGTRSTDFLFRVNPTNGNRTSISNFTDRTKGIVGTPVSIAFDGEEILVFGVFIIGEFNQFALINVDPDSGFRTLIAQFATPAFGRLVLELSENGNILAVDPAGSIFLLAFGVGTGGASRLWKVDLGKADPFPNLTLVSDFGNRGQGELGVAPRTMTVDASGNIWVTDSATDVLFRIDPTNGNRTVAVKDLKVTCAPAIHISGLTVDASGNILLTAEIVLGQNPGILFSFNPTSGVCTKVTDFAVRAGELGDSITQVAVVPTPVTQPPVDLSIATMEVTQAIQNFANDVPLVQDKTTYVRIYPKVDIADRRVGARLRGFRGGAELPGSPLRPLYPLATVHTTGAKRENLNDSFNFWIPSAWRSGKVTFQAEINFGGAIPETDTSNNVLSLEKEFIRKAPVCVTMIPVRTHGSRYSVNSPGFWSIITRFESLWPVLKVNVFYQSSPVEELQARFGIPPIEFGPYELPEDNKKVLNALFLRRFFSQGVVCPSGSLFRTVGMVSPDTNTGDAGAAYPNSDVSWVLMEANPSGSHNLPPGGVTMAQEIAHNFGGVRPWGHVDCPPGVPPGINPDYPYPPDQIGPDGPDTFWGFDPITRAIIQPKIGKDFMSYCGPEWVSDYTWTNIFDEINPRRAPVRSLETANALADLNQSAEILVVSGVITPTANVASFDYGYRLPRDMISGGTLEEFQPNLDTPTGAVPIYTLELVDVSKVVLFSLPFEPRTATTGDSAEQGFFLTVPFDPKTARVRITQNGRELGALTVSAHAPQVSILQPVGGETVTDRLTVRWEASDQDNDPLLYTVQYSPDLGASWQALITQTPETTLTLEDTLSLKGSDQALIRVIANDGVNTGSDTSDPFTVQRHMPVVHIDIPSNQALFTLNSQLVLMGSARDAEDGPLDGEALKWFVNGEAVGSGEEVAVGGLAPSTYEVTLEATDSDNNKTTASVTITVVDMPVANTDAYMTRPNMPLTVEAPGVLNNDTDPEGDPLSAVLVSDASNGVLTLKGDGSFTYTPNTDFSGVDSFTYKANDGTADSNIVAVSLGVTSSRSPISILVDIDIKPGTDSNPINPNMKGIIPVAILTTDTFDATQVDPLSVEFGPNGATETHGRGHVKDADRDGDMDLILHFKIRQTGIRCGDVSAMLTGKTLGGQAIKGTDSITTVGCNNDGS
jgi:hypothetical protein